MREVEVLVIGAGQAGLAMGYHLRRKKKSFAILGKETRIGDVWRKRYDSLVLFTPRSFSSLPGLPLEGDPDGFAGKDELAGYLETYAGYFDLPVHLETEVLSLSKTGGRFLAETSRGAYNARNVVVATGPFQKPFLPEIARTVSKDMYQVHTSQYRNPSSLQPGPVLVVGAGNSGAQIAVELAETRPVYLSLGHPPKFFPLVKFGKSIFWWFDKLGLMTASVESRLGRFLSGQHDPIFGFELRELINQGKIRRMPRTTSVQGREAFFADGSRIELANLIWATGFVSDYSWIQVSNALGPDGMPPHQRGVSPVEGLFYLGRPWQHTRGSALTGGVGRDAEFLSGRVCE